MRNKKFNRYFLIISTLSLLAASCVYPAPEGAQTPTPPSPEPTIVPTATEPLIPKGFVEYRTQSGDTLLAIAAHFGLESRFIEGDVPEDASRIIDPGTRLLIPDVLGETTPSDILFPDAAIVFSPEAVGFDIQAFADAQGGHLSTYEELMTRGTVPGSEIIAQLALDYSLNPRILLAFIEVESGWVRGKPQTEEQALYPFGFIRKDRAGIYQQLGLTVRRISQGYYEWRAGKLTELTFLDGEILRLAPSLNAGTVAVLSFFSHNHTRAEWEALVYGEDGIVSIYEALFGDPWERAVGLEPLFPAGIAQPDLNLPFSPNEKWNYTCGPHDTHYIYHYRKEVGPEAALDFAPPVNSPGCANSTYWTTASVSGRVVRVGGGTVVLDLDMDGHEQTGWALVYNHVADSHRVELDTIVAQDDRIGHPSCTGGSASGIHVHVMRKYNGEWVLADGGLPFALSGYEAEDDETYCYGTLDNGEEVVSAFPWGNYLTAIYRPDSDPKYLATPTPKP